MIIYAKVPIVTPLSDMQKDLQNVSQHWEEHFNKLHYEGSWTGLPLRSVEGSDSIIPGLTADDIFEDHRNMNLFPAVKNLLASFKCTIKSVRLLNLAAGAVIKPHCDNELCFEQGEVRLHVPIFTNPDVEFYVHDQKIGMQTGECWYINANLRHSVINAGKTDRIHLVIDCVVNQWMEKVIRSATVFLHAPDYTLQQLGDMIDALRIQNTVTANQLADEFHKQYNSQQMNNL